MSLPGRETRNQIFGKKIISLVTKVNGGGEWPWSAASGQSTMVSPGSLKLVLESWATDSSVQNTLSNFFFVKITCVTDANTWWEVSHMPTHKASRVDLSSHADKPPYGMGNVGGVGCARLATMSWQQQASLTGARSTNFGIPPPNYFVMTHYTSDADRVRFGGGGVLGRPLRLGLGSGLATVRGERGKW